MADIGKIVRRLGSSDQGNKWRAAQDLMRAASQGADITAAMPALAKAFFDADEQARERIASALWTAIQECASIGWLDAMETNLRRGYDVLKTECPRREREKSAGIGFSKVMKHIARCKNELAPQRDILLDDVPKPPKRGTLYRRLECPRRRVF